MRVPVLNLGDLERDPSFENYPEGNYACRTVCRTSRLNGTAMTNADREALQSFGQISRILSSTGTRI